VLERAADGSEEAAAVAVAVLVLVGDVAITRSQEAGGRIALSMMGVEVEFYPCMPTVGLGAWGAWILASFCFLLCVCVVSVCVMCDCDATFFGHTAHHFLF
jgi:hypothetical protein